MKASFTPAASAPARKGVFTYAEAVAAGDVELKAEMEKLIDRIDRNPESFDAVASFGEGPLQFFESWTRDVDRFFAYLPKQGAMPVDQIREIEKLNLARVEIACEVKTFLGAAPEALRRYSEEYIPQFQAMAYESRDPEDELALKDTVRRREELQERMALLESARLIGMDASVFLGNARVAQDLKQLGAEFTARIEPMMANWRDHHSGGSLSAKMPAATPQVELPQPIKVRKPLVFRQPA